MTSLQPVGSGGRSEREATAAGITPAQHQLLLAIRGQPANPTIGDVAGHLLLRHHSAVGLVDRAERAGLVRRHVDDGDHRVVRVALTPLGMRRLEALSRRHLAELDALRPHLGALRSLFP